MPLEYFFHLVSNQFEGHSWVGYAWVATVVYLFAEILFFKEFFCGYLCPYQLVHSVSVLTTELAKAGLIDATKGRYGGVKLTKGTTGMSIAAILAAIGEPQIQTECIMGFGKCAQHGTCKLHTKIVSSILALKQAFEKTTLAEIVEKEGKAVALPSCLFSSSSGLALPSFTKIMQEYSIFKSCS